MVTTDKQSTVVVSRELLERLQARLYPHIDAKLWGEICALLAARPDQSEQAADMVEPVAYLVEVDGMTLHHREPMKHPRAKNTPLYRHAQPPAKARVEALESMCAELYQVLGALDAPENVLDKVSAAACGMTIPDIELLPFVAEPPAKVVLPKYKFFSTTHLPVTDACVAKGWNACLDKVAKLNGVKS